MDAIDEDQARLDQIRARGRELEDLVTRQRRAAKEALAYVRREREELPIEARWDLTSDLILEIKSADDEERRVTGIATTPTVDRMGDVVDPIGATFESEIPLFLNHDSTKVVGTAHLGQPITKSIPFVAFIAKVASPGRLKDRCDEAWESVKSGLLRHVSIGFRAIAAPERRSNAEGRVYPAIEILELSLVPIPAQPDAKITGFKGVDARHAATPPVKAKRIAGLTERDFSDLLLKMIKESSADFARRRQDLDDKREPEHPVQLTQANYTVLRRLPKAAMNSALITAAAFTVHLAESVEGRLREEIAELDETIKSLNHRLDRHSSHLSNLQKRLAKLEPSEPA